MRIAFYIDKFGYPNASVFDGNPILATFLTNEIGFNSSGADYWRSEIKKGLADSSYYSSGTGNAHTIVITGASIKLINEFVLQDPEVECSGEQLLELIELWLSFLNDRQERSITLSW